MDALKKTGFPEEKYDISATLSIEEGINANKTAITTDSAQLIATPGIDVILEVTGNPAAGVRHALLVSRIQSATKYLYLANNSAVSTKSTS